MSAKPTLYDLFDSDRNLEKVGVWVEVGSARFKCRRAGGANDDYINLAAKKIRPFAQAIQDDVLPREMGDDLMAEVYAETIVLDWENVTDRQGGQIPFSKEACVALFKELPNVFALVRAQADRAGNFRDQAKAIAKN